MFCSRCGNKVDDNDVFCNKCGARQVQSITEIDEVKPIKVEVVNERKSSYNKWVRGISVIWGTSILLGSLGSGFPYYFKSGLLLVLICEIILISIGISLILLGLFPEYINTKVQIKNKYPEIIVGIIILTWMIFAIEPIPLEDWSSYNPNF